MEALMSDPEGNVTITATAFKTNCLDLFKRLERGTLARITVTRRGHAVAEIARPRAAPKKTFAEVYGCMRGTLEIKPGVDLTRPVADPEDWNAVRGILLDDKA